MQQRLLDQGCEPVDVPQAWVWHYVPAERMTIRWLLQRKYAGGKSLGLLEDKPVWDIVKSLIACVLNAIQGLARVDRAAAFAALTGFIEQTGRLLATLRTSTP